MAEPTGSGKTLGNGVAPEDQWLAGPEDGWTFDVLGFWHQPAVVRPDLLAALSVAADSDQLAEALAQLHPSLMECISNVNAGETRYRLAQTPRLLDTDTGGEWITSTAPEDLRRLAYEVGLVPERTALCKGFRVLYVLEDTDALGVAWCSHKSAKPPPPPATAAAMDALVSPPLRAGDLVLLAGTTLTAWQPGDEPGTILELILEHDSRVYDSMEAAMVPDPAFYKIDGGAADVGLLHARDRATWKTDVEEIGPAFPMPEWFSELSPEQQAVCGGHAGMGAVESDGENMKVKALPGPPAATTKTEAEQWYADLIHMDHNAVG